MEQFCTHNPCLLAVAQFMPAKRVPLSIIYSVCVVLKKIYDSTGFILEHQYNRDILSQCIHIAQHIHIIQHSPHSTYHSSHIVKDTLHIIQRTHNIQAHCSCGMINKSLSMDACICGHKKCCKKDIPRFAVCLLRIDENQNNVLDFIQVIISFSTSSLVRPIRGTWVCASFNSIQVIISCSTCCLVGPVRATWVCASFYSIQVIIRPMWLVYS